MHTTNRPPTPAAVRFLLRSIGEGTLEEETAYLTDDRGGEDILADHIRAVAQEMRSLAGKHEEDGWYTSAQSLKTFADKLEGKA